MKISIITVVYNNEKTIESAIKSVLAQSYRDIEYIIVDGASKDATVSIINKYSKQVLLTSEKDNGIYDAMNKGVSRATGDVIGILNSDDIYFDHTVIQKVADAFSNDDDLAILYGDLVYVKADDTDKVVRYWKSGPYHDRFFEYGNVPPHPSVFLRRRVYDECGLFNLKFRFAADYELMLRIFKRNTFKTKYVPKIFVRMRLGGATNQSFGNIYNGNKEILAAWRENNLKPPFGMLALKFLKRFKQFIAK
jgi:glycosyltransferase